MGYVEGTGDQLNDSTSMMLSGLSRIPNGFDSDNNNHDFQSSCITPGFANTLLSSNCRVALPEPTSLLLMLVGLITLIVGGYPRE